MTVGSGLDLDAGKEKALVARLAVLYTIVLGISLINQVRTHQVTDCGAG